MTEIHFSFFPSLPVSSSVHQYSLENSRFNGFLDNLLLFSHFHEYLFSLIQYAWMEAPLATTFIVDLDLEQTIGLSI